MGISRMRECVVVIAIFLLLLTDSTVSQRRRRPTSYRQPVCTQREFKCRNSQCIEASLRCNGANDCYDGSDEINCPRCRQDQFECADGSCISGIYRCNGQYNCPPIDTSDEQNCPVIPCSSDQFRCQDGTCISIEMRCNGRLDCRENEDEIHCGCGSSDFICADGQCVYYKLQCNGVNDCRDGSDERDCEKNEYYKAEKIVPRVENVIIERTGRTKVSGAIGSRDERNQYRVEGEPMKKSTNDTEIPMAGSLGDPRIEAFPELVPMLDGDVFKNRTSRGNSTSRDDDWEYFPIDTSADKLKSAKSKIDKNVEPDLDEVFKETRKVEDPVREAYPDLPISTEDNYEDFYDTEETLVESPEPPTKTAIKSKSAKSKTVARYIKKDLDDVFKETRKIEDPLREAYPDLPINMEDYEEEESTTFGTPKPLSKNHKSVAEKASPVKSDGQTKKITDTSEKPVNAPKTNFSDPSIRPTPERDFNDTKEITIIGRVYSVNESITHQSTTKTESTPKKGNKKVAKYFQKHNITPTSSESNSTEERQKSSTSRPLGSANDIVRRTKSKDRSAKRTTVLKNNSSDHSTHSTLKSSKFPNSKASTLAMIVTVQSNVSHTTAKPVKIKSHKRLREKFDRSNKATQTKSDDKLIDNTINKNHAKHSIISSVGTSKKLTSSTTPARFTASSQEYHPESTTEKPEKPGKKIKADLTTKSTATVVDELIHRNSSDQLTNDTSASQTEFSDVTTQRSFRKYVAKYSITPQPTGSTDKPLKSHEINTDLGLLPNSTTSTNQSKHKAKLSSYSKNSKNVDFLHRITKILHSTTSSKAIESSTVTSSTNDSSPDLISSPTVRKFKKYSYYMNKYNVTRSHQQTLETNMVTEATSSGSIVNMSFTDNTKDKHASRKESLNAPEGTKKKSPRNRDKVRGSKDWKKGKGRKRKIDPYRIVKVESEVYEKHRTNLPKRLEFANADRTKVVSTKAPTVETSPDDHESKNCSAACSECLKKMNAASINLTTPNTVESKEFFLDDKSNEKVDSGLIETTDNQTISSLDIGSIPDDSREVEWVTFFSSTKKPRKRYKSTSTMRTTDKIEGNERSTVASGKSKVTTVKARKRTGKRRKNGRKNGNGKRRRKTTSVMTTEKTATTARILDKEFWKTTEPSPRSGSFLPNSINLIKSTAPSGTDSTMSGVDGESPTISSSTFELTTIMMTSESDKTDSTSEQGETGYENWFDVPHAKSLKKETTALVDTTPEAETSKPASTTAGKVDPAWFGWMDGESSEVQDSALSDETIEQETPLPPTTRASSDCPSFSCWLNQYSKSRESSRSTSINHPPTTRASITTSVDESNSSTIQARQDHESAESQESTMRGVISDDNIPPPVVPDSSENNINIGMKMNISEEIMSILEEVTKAPTTSVTTGSYDDLFAWLFRPADLHSDTSTEVIATEPSTQRDASTSSIFTKTTVAAENPTSSSSCRGDQHRCDRDRCINANNVCDGTTHCYDASDEAHCQWRLNRIKNANDNVRCRIDQHECDRYMCLEMENVCDGMAHCRDGSDESGCDYYMDLMNEVLSDYRGRYRFGQMPRSQTTTTPRPHRKIRWPIRRRPCHPEVEYRCHDGKCIPEYRQCDGYADCLNAEDENPRFCGESPYCPDGQSACDNGVCISRSFFCDRNVDCLDGSDERNCPASVTEPPQGCRTDQFTCSDGSCIAENSRCDGRADCPDDEDERDCRRGCSRDDFECRNGDCIGRTQKCDGRIDCDDGSDEKDCEPEIPSQPHNCTSSQFTCVYDRTCVHYSARCNGIPECRDHSDEEGCETEIPTEGLNLKTYPSDQIARESVEVVFQCRDEGLLRAKVRWIRGNGLPLPPGSRDVRGRLEIPNIQLDHAGTYICEAAGYSASTPGRQVSVHLEVEKSDHTALRPPHVCKYDEATCSNGECIPKYSICDGNFDCTDGSDEIRCSPHGQCEPNQFRCANNQCVLKIWRCDGEKDCADGNDEENCAAPPPGSPCRYDEYSCGNSDQCIPKSFHCDGRIDCQDHTDEVGCSRPYIVDPPTSMMHLKPGDTLILTCTAVGVPIPEVNWRLNWGHLPTKCSSVSLNGTGTLTCPDIQVPDQGAYSCEAINVVDVTFATPDAIVTVEQPTGVCPPGKFNSEARTSGECISCFCFGVSDKCTSANLFTYQIPPPFDRYRLVTVELSPELRILGEVNSQVAEIRPRGSNGAEISALSSNELSYNTPYFALPSSYYGPSQLRSYGGYLKYSVSYSGNGSPNYAPDVVISGNGYNLVHRGVPVPPDVNTQRSVRFFYGEWYKNYRGQEIPASREEIMMVLARVEQILIKAKYEDSPELQVSITDIAMDTAGTTNTGLAAPYVEECTCPTGYTGESCEGCAPGYARRQSGPWLGECYRDEPPCGPGYYGDPSRNIPCKRCECPLPSPSNQFARTCRMGADRNPICDCPPGYAGLRCEKCAAGYHGNPLMAGDSCVPDELCDSHGSITRTVDNEGKCSCKLYATGLKCDQCKANTFNLASKNQFGCISCFCMGHTDRCTSSNWYRNEIRVPYIERIEGFGLVESNASNAKIITQGLVRDSVNQEVVYGDFPNRGNADVYYWHLPGVFLGNRIASYGGDLRYTVKYEPLPGGQSSRNNAADVELISANDINLLYFSRRTPEANSPQSFTVPLLEQHWQRTDGTQADREHMLMALADVREIRIKATYTTHTSRAGLSNVSLVSAEKNNNGNERAVEVEECSCPIGYRGLSCEDCAVGYTRSMEGIYLGRCELCFCNGHSSQCDPETGACENCRNHTTGENCDLCEPGYSGDPSRGGCTRTHTSPTSCRCNPAGSESDRCIGDRCMCKSNVEGAECNRCRPSTFGLSAENPNGCNECYCSGVTDQCHESSLFIQQIPMVAYDSRHGFTLTDATNSDVIDDGFDLNVASNEIGYRYSNNRKRRLFWSLPHTFIGNKIKSYGGNLTLTQHITAHANAQVLKDQDVVLMGNGIRLFWTNPQEIVPGIPMTYTVPLRESEWRRVSTEGLRQASRNDLMTVLSNLEAILVRASYSEGMTATYISDISLDTAVENFSGTRATQIEACRCPPGYSGTSCETCATGYYRDVNDRSSSFLGSCKYCPCSDRGESCELTASDQIKCHCPLGYAGQYCEDIVDYRQTTPPPAPLNNPPRIIVTIQEKKFQIVHIGSTVSYHCNGRSLDNTPLQIRWTKEGGHLPDRSVEDRSGLLVLRDVRVSDSGVYVCQASDGISSVVEKVTLTVGGSNLEAPKVNIHLDSHVLEGSPLQCTCEATGNPQPEIEWIRVHGRMNPHSIFHNGVWRLPAVSRDDAGEYKCIARNEAGFAEQSIQINVPADYEPSPGYDMRPKITPNSWVGSEGDPVTLVCEKTHHHSRVVWSRAGHHSAVRHEANGVLTIRNPIPSDSGTYVCTATSHQGVNYNSTVNVSIYPKRAPSIRVEPDRQVVYQGTSAEVRCIVDRDSGLRITWTKYNTSSLGPNARQVGDTLFLTKPQVADRGIYVCQASNAAASYQASATIDVEPREMPVLELHPARWQSVNLGGSTHLQCRVTAGFPTPDVQWSREDGRRFGPNIAQLPGGVLRLTNVTLNDGGAYKCSATNVVGHTSEIAHIEVHLDPKITILPHRGLIYAKANSELRLNCSAQGIPQPTVAWTKIVAGVPVDNWPEGSSSGAIYDILSMSPTDEGLYTCRAINTVGVAEDQVQLRIKMDDDVLQYPNITSITGAGVTVPGEYLEIPNGGRVEIRCQVFKSDGTKIYLDWKRNDRRPLPEGSTVRGGVLTIPKVTKHAAGEYVCVGLDQAGVEIFQASSHLHVVSPPMIQLNPNRQTVGLGESPAIVCTATGDQPMSIEWEGIGQPLPPTVTHDHGVLQFHGIRYSDAGKYVCKATNNAGTADAVAEVLVSEHTSDDTGIRAVERNVSTLAGNTVRLRCSVQQRSTIHWTKDGRPLSRKVVVGEDYIELLRVQPEDSGKYICQIRNSYGVSSDYINLRVDEAIGPAVTIEPSLDVVNIGDMIDLRCTYTGTQNPRYRWSRPYHRSLPAKALEHGNILRISDIELSESGVYRCHVDTQEATYDQDFNLIVQGGTNDAPAIETKFVPYGSSLEMGCRMDLEPPIKFHWSKLGGALPRDVQTFGNKLKLIKVKSDDAGTYICTATNDVESSEVPTVLVVTGVVPNFNQAPHSWISLPPLPESYLKFSIDVSFKPERDDGIILYNDEEADGTGDFISLALVRGYPEFKFDLGSGMTVIRADKPVSLSEWHTIKLQRTRKEGTMIVDGEDIYRAINPGRKQGLDLKEPLYVGGVPDYSSINAKVEMNTGFVGCISRLVLGEKSVDLIGDQSDSVGVTTCETCAENPCNNAGVCQEAPTRKGYKCLCRAGYSGQNCDSIGQTCFPGACGEGSCSDTETGFECFCPHGRSGNRCEFATTNLSEPLFRGDRSFIAYPTPAASRRAAKRLAIKAKRSHARSSHTSQLRKGSSRSAHLKHRNVHGTKH